MIMRNPGNVQPNVLHCKKSEKRAGAGTMTKNDSPVFVSCFFYYSPRSLSLRSSLFKNSNNQGFKQGMQVVLLQLRFVSLVVSVDNPRGIMRFAKFLTRIDTTTRNALLLLLVFACCSASLSSDIGLACLNVTVYCSHIPKISLSYKL